MFTDEQAKKKWCPMARVGVRGMESSYSYNRTLTKTIPAQAQCIGSKCMLWQPTPPEQKSTEKTGQCGLMIPILG
jgi:hypothetical protein